MTTNGPNNSDNSVIILTCAQDPGSEGGLQQQVSSTWPVSLSLQMWLQWAAPTSTYWSSGESMVGPKLWTICTIELIKKNCDASLTWEKCDTTAVPASKSSGLERTGPRMVLRCDGAVYIHREHGGSHKPVRSIPTMSPLTDNIFWHFVENPTKLYYTLAIDSQAQTILFTCFYICLIFSW